MLNKYLGQLLAAHHIEYTELDGKYQITDGISISAEASVGKPPAELSAQGNYILKVGRKEIIESFALPAGTNEDDFCKEMTDYFDAASFHVMMSDVFGTEDEQNSYEEWEFHGIKRKMIIGGVNLKFPNELIQTDLHLTDFFTERKTIFKI